MTNLDKTTIEKIIRFQKSEITEHYIYAKLAKIEKNENNKTVLRNISEEEYKHYGIWKSYSGKEVRPDRMKIGWYVFISRLFGVTFGIKLMETGEEQAQFKYSQLISLIPAADKIMADERQHEQDLMSMVNEEKLKYISSIVLGLNDALVELTGTLAGLTFALQNARLVGVAGLITGIAASLSMAASEYLSTKAEAGDKNPLRASFYTGCTYVFAVTVLIMPFLLLGNPFVSLFASLIGAVFLILTFTFYYAVVRGVSFKKRFLEMLGVSLGVAGLSFLIGLLVRQFLKIDI